jgi:glycosidase
VGDCLKNLAKCFKYWIALTDCDGFRIDTLKHVSFEQARNFCGSVKEFAAGIGKADFFLVGEVAGGDFGAGRYLDVLERNLNAALDIGETRMALNEVAKGFSPPSFYFSSFTAGAAAMGSHRNLGERHVSVLDDHDHVFGDKVRFSSFAASPVHVVAATALQLFSLGIPCIYYGTEQSLAGPEPGERHWLPGWNDSNAQHSTRYLREAMFGPEHPLKDGREGLTAGPGRLDPNLPGFGPFGTAGRHCFDTASAAYVRIAALAAVRRDFPALRYGRQYLRDTAGHDQPLQPSGAGGIVAWSRILDEEECICVVNTSVNATIGADVLIDATLNPIGTQMRIIINTAQAGGAAVPSQPAGADTPVQRRPNGTAFVRIDALRPAEVLVFTNRP